MYGKIAAVFAICILLSPIIAPANDIAERSPPTVPGTRAVSPGLSIWSNISDDTPWNLDPAYSFIWVRKNIWVLENATLTIQPGVVVRFDPGTGLHIRGGIIADGAPYQNISFIPLTDTPATLDWLGITVENATRPCIFDNVNVRFSEVGIGCWGTDASITNSTIAYNYYYGILCGRDSSPTVSKNYVNFTTWAGIVCDNRSTPLVEKNYVRTSYYGIVCYDVAQVRNNTIENCWLGIIGWGNSTISNNTVQNCRDGIHGFYASPLIINNAIMGCDGNGTRFMHSNATLINNRLTSNKVGMDIDYASRNILNNMVNNLVNGIEITDCFYVGESDIVLDGLLINSGWPTYSGSLTAQGSVTFYDCKNVTIRNSTVTHAVNSVFAANSTFTIYNCTFDDATGSQVYLDQNATGVSFNSSVDPDSVVIGGMNCLFQTFDDLRVMVLDFYGFPIEGATVAVRESQLELYNVTTGPNGTTENMVVKDRTVTDAGVISSPLLVYVFTENYNFAPNPRTGVFVSDDDFIIFNDLGDIFPPRIVNITVTEGDRSFAVNGTISILFSEPMNTESVENAFAITGNITGTFTWDSNNTRVTFTSSGFNYATYYTLTLSTGAMDVWNNSIEDPLSLSFTTARAPGTSDNTVMIAIIVIFAIAGIAGLLMVRRLGK